MDNFQKTQRAYDQMEPPEYWETDQDQTENQYDDRCEGGPKSKKLVMIGISKKGDSRFKIRTGDNHDNSNCINIGLCCWDGDRGIGFSDGNI